MILKDLGTFFLMIQAFCLKFDLNIHLACC